jgi:hypothetical protein
MEGSLAREREGSPGSTKLDSLRDAVDRLVAEMRPRLNRPSEADDTQVFVIGFGLRVPGHAVGDLLALHRVYKRDEFATGSEAATPAQESRGDGHSELQRFAEDNGYDAALPRFARTKLDSTEAHYLTRALRKDPRSVAKLKTLIPQSTVKAAGRFAWTQLTKDLPVIGRDPFQQALDLAYELIGRETGENADDVQRRIIDRALRRLGTQLDAVGPVLVSPREIADLWQRAGSSRTDTESVKHVILGNTPICEAMRTALGRFNDPRLTPPDADKLLLILTDGQSTDGDPEPIAAELKRHGVTVYSCFVANSDVASPRHLFRTSQTGWTNAATTMFNVASTATPTAQAVQQLREDGWQADSECHLFAQVNHSEVLTQFIRSVVDTATPQGNPSAPVDEPWQIWAKAVAEADPQGQDTSG